VSREGEKYNFQKGGGGINIVFGPKYRPLYTSFGWLKTVWKVAAVVIKLFRLFISETQEKFGQPLINYIIIQPIY
jgi:hypothetical protein